MDQIFVLLLAAFTSVAAYLGGVRRLGLSPLALRAAVLSALQFVGMGIVFLVVNLAVGLVAVFAIRSFTAGFLSVYLLNDPILILLSALQGITFECWRGRADLR